MKKKQQSFCNLMATSMYEDYHAVEVIWGDKYVDSKEKAKLLMESKAIVERIANVKQAHATRGVVNRTWVTNTLLTLVDTALLDGDASTARYALDMINKMSGYYEKDNQQKQDVSLTMTF